MARQGEITLIVANATPSGQGYPTEVTTETLVFSLTKSATRSEFYAASAAGKTATDEFCVWNEDWCDAAVASQSGKLVYPNRVRFGVDEYDIVRDYSKDGVRRYIYGKRRT